MANPFPISLTPAVGYKYVDITDISGIGQENNVLPPSAQIGDQIYYEQFDSKGTEVFIDSGGNVTADGSFTYWYYTDSARQWGPAQLFGLAITISYNLIGTFRPDVILEGTFRPDITLIGRLET